jgi:hypothetical protein
MPLPFLVVIDQDNHTRYQFHQHWQHLSKTCSFDSCYVHYIYLHEDQRSNLMREQTHIHTHTHTGPFPTDTQQGYEVVVCAVGNHLKAEAITKRLPL